MLFSAPLHMPSYFLFTAYPKPKHNVGNSINVVSLLLTSFIVRVGNRAAVGDRLANLSLRRRLFVSRVKFSRHK